MRWLLILAALLLIAAAPPPKRPAPPTRADPPNCTLPDPVKLSVRSFFFLQAQAMNPNFKRQITAQDYEDLLAQEEREVKAQAICKPPKK